MKFGAPAKLTEQLVARLRADMKRGGVSVRDIAAKHGISRATAYRLAQGGSNVPPLVSKAAA